MIPLPDEFLTRPLAHRGYHGRDRPENSWPACEAAIDAGYGIELDVQMSSDGHAVVFHDDTLHRMTAKTGPVNALTLKDLSKIELNGEATQICSLTEILERVAGRTPVLVEVKDFRLMPEASFSGM